MKKPQKLAPFNSKDERFKKKTKSAVPGPGTY